jgi:hypothetical protein
MPEGATQMTTGTAEESPSRGRKVAPYYSDIEAACAYTRLMVDMQMDSTIVREAVQATMKMFRAYVSTLDMD